MAQSSDSSRRTITVFGNPREIINLVFNSKEIKIEHNRSESVSLGYYPEKDQELSELQLEIEELGLFEEKLNNDIRVLMDELNEINCLLGRTDYELKNAGETITYAAKCIFEDNITKQILETLIKEDDDQLKQAQLEIAKLQDDNRLAESESSVSGVLEEKIQGLMLQIQIIQEKNKDMEILNCQKVDEVKRLTQTVIGLEPVLSGGEGKFHETDVKGKKKQLQDKLATKRGGRRQHSQK